MQLEFLIAELIALMILAWSIYDLAGPTIRKWLENYLRERAVEQLKEDLKPGRKREWIRSMVML